MCDHKYKRRILGAFQSSSLSLSLDPALAPPKINRGVNSDRPYQGGIADSDLCKELLCEPLRFCCMKKDCTSSAISTIEDWDAFAMTQLAAP